MALIDFYVSSFLPGDNRNSGSTYSATPYYSTTGGNWVQGSPNCTFTPTDGSNPAAAGVKSGDFVSLFRDGASLAQFIGVVTGVVNAANGAITVYFTGAGQVLTTGGGTSLRAGGAWFGPNGNVGFPFTLTRLGALTHNRLNPLPYTETTRILFDNNYFWTITATISIAVQGDPVIFEYDPRSPPEAGNFRALFAGESANSRLMMINNSGGDVMAFNYFQFRDNFVGAGTFPVPIMVQLSGANVMRGCVFEDSNAADGLFMGNGGLAIECLARNCNKRGQNYGTGFRFDSSTAVRCVSGPHTGAHTHGFVSYGCHYSHCIAYNCTGHGIAYGSSGGLQNVRQCDFYNNARAGISMLDDAEAGVSLQIENSNFVANAYAAINLNPHGLGGHFPQGWMSNCGFGTGSMANGPNEWRGAIEEKNTRLYTPNTTPWTDPDNGNFIIASVEAAATGTGVFYINNIHLDPNNTIYGHPSIGAVQTPGGGGGVIQPPGGGGGGPPGGGGGGEGAKKIVYKTRDITDLVSRTRKAIKTIENIRIVGENVTGNPINGFALND